MKSKVCPRCKGRGVIRDTPKGVYKESKFMGVRFGGDDGKKTCPRCYGRGCV